MTDVPLIARVLKPKHQVKVWMSITADQRRIVSGVEELAWTVSVAPTPVQVQQQLDHMTLSVGRKASLQFRIQYVATTGLFTTFES